MLNIKSAQTLPASFYTEDSSFAACKENIFAKTWQLVTDLEDIPLTNSVQPINFLPGLFNEPILVTRNGKYEINCFSNVCTHRAALLVDGFCRQKQIKCPYHGRRFNLQGEFCGTPGFKEAHDFPREEDNLHNYPIFIWNRFAFVSLNPIAPAEEFLQEMIGRLTWLDFKGLKTSPKHSREYLIKAHWALYVDNYLEGFHIPFVHDALSGVLDCSKYSYELYQYSCLQLGIGKDNQKVFNLPENSPDHGKQIAAYYFWVFPNIMFNFYPWGLSINVVQPINKELTKVKYLVYINETFDESDNALVDRTEKEDEYVVESCQRGMKSRAYKTGRFSPTEEIGTYHFQSLIKKFLS